MSLDQLKAFLWRMQDHPVLRLSGQKMRRVTVTEQDIPGEHH
ncbi:MAG: hypothetical protein VKI83_06320 [Synechococcaceae cyanobacterium]|nr:hypothetical protein [Synechococcaceae cyanobacterium]